MLKSFLFPGSYSHAQYYGKEEVDDLRLLSLQELNAALDFRIEYKDDEKQYKYLGTDEADQPKFSQKRTTFEERIRLEGRGSVYHPNLLDFRLDTSFGLRQENNRGGVVGNQNKTLYEHDLDISILKEKKFNFILFSRMFQTTIDRELYERIDVDTDSIGGRFFYQHELFPMRLLLQSSKVEHDSLSYKRLRKEKVAEFDVSNTMNDILESEFRYRYKNTDDRFPVKQKLTQHDLNFTNIIDYKKTHGISNVFYYKRTGYIETDQLQVHENFYVDHSETFRTIYNYNFNYFKNQRYKTKRNYGDIGFRHKLYESLVTEVSCEASYISDNINFSELYYEPKFALSYQKKVPGGLFTAGYFISYRKTDRDADEGPQKIFEEKIVLSDGKMSFLTKPNVVIDTVVVRDEDGVILTRYIHYNLITTGSVTEIRRRDLPNNTTVFVDYEYESSGSLKYGTLTTTVNIRYSLRQLLSFYYLNSSVTHDQAGSSITRFAGSPLQETKRTLYGVELTWRWFNVDGEYEDDSSDLIPFKAWRLRGRFMINPTDFLSFTLNGNHVITRYQESERGEVNFDSVDANLNVRLNHFLEADLRAGFYREDGKDIDTRMWSFRADLTSSFRSIELKLQSELLNKKEIRQDHDEFNIKFRLIRYFNII